jgi:hypothetical protein
MKIPPLEVRDMQSRLYARTDVSEEPPSSIANTDFASYVVVAVGHCGI